MPLHNMFDDREAQSRSTRRAAATRIGAIKTAGQMRDVLWFDPFALIFDGQQRPSTIAELERDQLRTTHLCLAHALERHASDPEARAGLVPPAELDALVERIHVNSGGASRKATGAAASNLDLYQVNCSFFDALGGDDEAYLAARAIQFFLPGVPQVYYVGLLAGHNDMALLQASGVGRDINRHHYTATEIAAELQRPVVQRLLALVRLRNTHPAFGGAFDNPASADDRLCLRWTAGDTTLTLDVQLGTLHWHIVEDGPDGKHVLTP